jgi:hypothetical protein
MATVTLDLNRRLQANDESELAWWRQRHTYVLAAVVAVQVVACRWVMQFAEEAGWAGIIALGVLMGQCFLLGLWGALGGLGTLPRWGIIGLVLLAGLASMALGPLLHGVGLRWDGLWTEVLELGILGALMVLVFAACLLPLRGLAGWRVDFDERVYRHLRGRRGQVGFMDFAGYSLGVAAALAAARLSIQAEILDADTLLIVFGLLFAVLAVAAPIAYALIVWRLWPALALSAVWALAAAAANSCLASYFPDLDFLDSPVPTFAGLRLALVAFYAGIALATAVTLVPLRLFGLKILVVPLPQLAPPARNPDFIRFSANPSTSDPGSTEAKPARAA